MIFVVFTLVFDFELVGLAGLGRYFLGLCRLSSHPLPSWAHVVSHPCPGPSKRQKGKWLGKAGYVEKMIIP